MAFSQQLGELVWKITGDNTDANKKIKQTEKEAKSFGSKISSAFKTIGFAAVIAGVTSINKALVNAASAAEEAENAVNVTFKEGAKTIQDFAKTTSDSVGLSSTAFKELSTVIGAQLKQSGLPLQEVANQTVDLSKRAADLASVFNTEVTEATTALGAALRGESEPARRFGVNISDAAVQAEALSSGLVETKNEITDQIKVQARLNLIFKQSADVAGDFQNTSDGLANGSRILRARFQEVQIALGRQLLPAAERTVKVLTEITGATGFAEKAAKGLQTVLNAWAVSFKVVTAAFKPFAVLGVTAWKLIALGIREVNDLIDPFIDKIKSAASAVKNFISPATDLFDKVFGKGKEKLEELTEGVGENSEALKILKEGLGSAFDFGIIDSVQKLIEDFNTDIETTTGSFNDLGDAGEESAVKTGEAWSEVRKNFRKFLEDNEVLLDNLRQGVGFISGSFSAASDLASAQSERRIENIDRELEASLESAEARGASEEELAKITEEAEKKKAQEEYKGRLSSWKFDLLNTTSAAALAVARALAVPPAPNIPLSVLAGIQGGLQIAAVTAAKPQVPSFDVGTMRVGQDQLANIHKDEIILPASLSEEARKEGISIAPTGSSGGSTLIQIVTETGERLKEWLFEGTKNQEIKIADTGLVVV